MNVGFGKDHRGFIYAKRNATSDGGCPESDLLACQDVLFIGYQNTIPILCRALNVKSFDNGTLHAWV